MATNKRASGGGRTANSIPKAQVFKQFSGCNFELSPRTFGLEEAEYEYHQEQSDLQMNYVVIQNNAKITSNNTIETRNNLEHLISAPNGKGFSKACIMVKNRLYLSFDDGSLEYLDLDNISSGLTNVTINDISPSDPEEHHWTDFEYVDDKLIGTTEENTLWSGLVFPTTTLENAREIADPSALIASNVQGKGITISGALSDSTPYRFAISIAYISKFGPTKASKPLVLYASKPIDEWHAGAYARITGTITDEENTVYGVEAVEIYYTSGNANNMQLAGRVDNPNPYPPNPATSWTWTFNWYGYLDATNMWAIANLVTPTQNYTKGVPVSKVKCIDSRVYFWGDNSDPYRLWIGGNFGNLLSVSPGTGGGFVDVEPGTGQEIRSVMKYKTQSGASIVTMLCNSPNSRMEQRFNLVENSISLSNEQSMKSWQAEQVAGAVGVKSFDGAVVCEDGLYSVSRYGLALTTMTMEYNSQIRANYVSDQIKPVFTDKLGSLLSNSILLDCDGVLYLTFGTEDDNIDNLIFCYDINKQAWWTISIELEEDEKILSMVHIDYEGYREGIGIITNSDVYMLPLTEDDDISTTSADFDVLIQTGELSTVMPQQQWEYVSQLEFRFDYFKGSVVIELTGIDQFGRKIVTKKKIDHEDAQYNLAEYMRVDLRLQSYQIRITGQAKFRMSHFITKLFLMSAKQGLVWGFDDSQTYKNFGDIHPTFKDYNDIRKAIIP